MGLVSALHVLRKTSELVDQIHAEKELVARFSAVIGREIPGVVETYLGPEHNSAANVLRGVQSVLRILCGEPGPLALLIVEKIGSESDHEFRIDLSIQIIDDGIFRRGAAQPSGLAERPIRSQLRGM